MPTNELSHSNYSTSPHHRLNSKNIWIISSIIAAIVIIGIVLIKIGFNEPLYSQNPTIYSIFKVITEFGGDYAYIFFFLLIYLTIDKEFAERIIFNFLISLNFTNFFKLTFQDPRPSTSTIEASYGFPSGHTTGTLSFWGYVALNVQEFESKRSKWLVGIGTTLLIILVPISRLVIGVHDLGDIIGGVGLAGFLLLLYSYWEPKISVAPWSMGKRIWIGVISGLLMWLICSLLLYWIHPSALWEQVEDMAQPAGLFIGLSITIPIEHHYIQYNPKALSVNQKIIAGTIGIVIGIAFYFGLSILFGLFPDTWNPIMRGVRYFLFAIVLGLGLPSFFVWLFEYLKKSNEKNLVEISTEDSTKDSRKNSEN
ncbi:MAG: phosphatase PAP2 family protein [Candidatus Lokiarchaeota archaeon]|nr:phosphatase PAP2 family protein [Candidatus Harpocratesius repetitus]